MKRDHSPFHQVLHLCLLIQIEEECTIGCDVFQNTKTRQDNLIVFSIDKNKIKHLAPLVARGNRSGPCRRKKNKRNLVISVQEKKEKKRKNKLHTKLMKTT